MMMALRPFSANMALHMGVTMGLVVGVTAPTTPMGLATSTRPFSGSRPMMPTLLPPFISCQMMRALPWFFLTLSSYTPMRVSSTAMRARGSALS